MMASGIAQKIIETMRTKTRALSPKVAEVVEQVLDVPAPRGNTSILMSCRMPMGTRYVNRGGRKFRLTCC